MSDTKNVNYHYIHQNKHDIKLDNIHKTTDLNNNLASQIKTIFTTSKFPSTTLQLPSRINKESDPKVHHKIIDINQPKTNNFLTIDNTRSNNSAFPKLTLNETKSSFVDSNNTDSSFKRNIRSQSKEINRNNYYRNNSVNQSNLNNNLFKNTVNNINRTNGFTNKVIENNKPKETKVILPGYNFKNSSLLNNNIFSNMNQKATDKNKTCTNNVVNMLNIKPLSVRELGLFGETVQLERKAQSSDQSSLLGDSNSPVKATSRLLNNDLGSVFDKKGSCIKEYAYKEEQNSRFRAGMEDFYKIVDNYLGDVNKGLFTLFDGHGGPDVAKYSKERFPDIFSKCLLDSNQNVKNALITSFSKLDEEIKLGISDNMGSTISVIYITQEIEVNTMKYVIYTANAGDSRVVLVSKDGVKRLSYDHKCSDFSEINRIRQNGGIIIEGRILGQLILSRAIGDHSLKRFGVICTPHVNKHVMTENDRYIVMASDGLWDVINDFDLLKLINNNSSLNLTQLTQFLVKYALDNGSTDNISCMILRLN